MPKPHEVRPGIWKVRVYAGDGRVKSRTFAATGARDAERKAPHYVTEIHEEAKVEATRRGTVAELVERWQRHQQSIGRSATHRERCAIICDRITSRLGKIKLGDLSALDCDDFYDWVRTLPGNGRRGQISETTVLLHHRVLTTILRQGEKWEKVDRVATRNATTPRPEEFEITPPSNDDLRALVLSLPPELGLPVLIDAQTGLRRGELFGLRWFDVDLNLNVLHVRNNTVVVAGQMHDTIPKGRKARDVPLSVEAGILLAAHRERCRAASQALGSELAHDARVLPDLDVDPTGRTPLHPNWLSGAWLRHCRRQGAKVRFHDLRHWCATHLLEQGLSVPDVQSILGHSKPSTTLNIYGHGRKDHNRVRDAMAGVLAISEGRVALNPSAPQ